MKPIYLTSLALFAACSTGIASNKELCAMRFVEPLASLGDLGGILFEARDIYWTEQAGAVKRLNKSTKRIEPLAQLNASPQQLCKQGNELIWYQNSTTYEDPNRLIRFDLNTKQSQNITIDYLAKTPELICQQGTLFFINRGRKLIEADPDSLHERLRLSGAPLQAQASRLFIYVLQREFQALKYSHNSLLQIDPITNTTNTLLGPPLSPLYFVLQGETLYTSVYDLNEDHYAILKHTPKKTTEIFRSQSPLSTLAADESHLYFTQQEPSGYTIYQLDLKQLQLTPWLEGLAYAPTHLSLDADFLYWVGLHNQTQWLLQVTR
jgi:hypothetical protein